MTSQKPALAHAKRMTIANAILAFVVLIIVLQIWLLTVSVNAFLGGDYAILWPAFFVSLICLALNGGLLIYLRRLG